MYKGRKPFEKGREIGDIIHTMNGTKETLRLAVQLWQKVQANLLDPDPYASNVIATIHPHSNRGQKQQGIQNIVELPYRPLLLP